MNQVAIGSDGDVQGVGLLDKARTIAAPGFNRWLVPPAALAIHLCIGMAYGFSVFWLPLSHAIGISKSVECPADMSAIASIFSSTCDWKISMLGWMFTLFFVFLGTASAIWGGWLEHAGPRKAGVVAAICWCGGLLISAFGVYIHQLWLLWVGSGVIGGIGLGLGYISPVSTLIKWFPDRRGMATGMAIMGFGGGAMIGAPLSVILMKHFATPTDVGVWQTFVCLAAIYFVFMVGGAFGYRVPPVGWKPAGWTPPANKASGMITTRHVDLATATRTKQFWLIWWVLCLNVTAGIGIIGMASPMLQEVFAGHLIGIDVKFNDLTLAQKGQIAAIAAGFTGLLSLFNIGGRFVWATVSDYIGRKNTYYTFLILGIVLYASAPWSGHLGHVALFVAAFCVILSMYGGGFSTVPAYLADIFGTEMVGAIHGRLLTAWSAAGIFGPVIVNYVREYQLNHGVPRAQVYDITAYILCGLLLIGVVLNWMVRPVDESKYMSEAQLEAERRVGHQRAAANGGSFVGMSGGAAVSPAVVVVSWLLVGIPLAWGVMSTLGKAAALFK
ncbi:MAG TPA: OFA family MFS transporter [Usitatibacter sp.]|jgi:MFS family permease|nr:OFA family MFS transporter [Usitatibacter sp.]